MVAENHILNRNLEYLNISMQAYYTATLPAVLDSLHTINIDRATAWQQVQKNIYKWVLMVVIERDHVDRQRRSVTIHVPTNSEHEGDRSEAAVWRTASQEAGTPAPGCPCGRSSRRMLGCLGSGGRSLPRLPPSLFGKARKVLAKESGW